MVKRKIAKRGKNIEKEYKAKYYEERETLKDNHTKGLENEFAKIGFALCKKEGN